MTFHVAKIGKQEANELVTRLHYSGSSVWAVKLHLGVWWEGELIGVLQFGPPMNPRSKTFNKYVTGSRPEHWMELSRMVFTEERPAYAGSKVISMAMRIVKAQFPDVAVIQSFADSRCHLKGAVYQAANFVYVGSHMSGFYRLDGEWFHKSLWNRAPIDKRGWGSGPKAARLSAGKDRAVLHVFEQYRYLYFLKKWARRRLAVPSLAYPKQEDRYKQ